MRMDTGAVTSSTSSSCCHRSSSSSGGDFSASGCVVAPRNGECLQDVPTGSELPSQCLGGHGSTESNASNSSTSSGSSGSGSTGLVRAWYKGELLVLAEELGRRLLPAFRTPTGIPYAWVNLKVLGLALPLMR